MEKHEDLAVRLSRHPKLKTRVEKLSECCGKFYRRNNIGRYGRRNGYRRASPNGRGSVAWLGG